jgi:ABC-type nitrate/sulfonate/bicarbonate transport system ATPase subunit
MSESRESAIRLQVHGVSHSYGSLEVLRQLSIDVNPGEFVSILGPSGSGKSTLFSILTGGTRASSGSVLIDGESLRQPGQQFAFMPQQDALLPWRRLIDNLTLGLEVQGVKRAAARDRVRELLPVFGLDEFEQLYPFQLSGGMRQRAALLRTVVQDRKVLLLDEPFGALDALTRTQMQQWLESVWEDYRWTVLLITHDVREAVFLSDRVYVFSPRPATIVAEVAVPLTRPRTLEMMTDPAFVEVESELLSTLLGQGSQGSR